MNSLGRSAAIVGSALAIAVAFGCGSASSAAAKRAVSPCGTVNAPAWSPDGTPIAWFGYRWPHPHRPCDRGATTPCARSASRTRTGRTCTSCRNGLQRALLQRSARGAWASSTGRSRACSWPRHVTTGSPRCRSARSRSYSPRHEPDPVLHRHKRRWPGVAQRAVHRRLLGLPWAGEGARRPVRRGRRAGRRHEGLQRRPGACHPTGRRSCSCASSGKSTGSEAFDLDGLGRRQPPANGWSRSGTIRSGRPPAIESPTSLPRADIPPCGGSSHRRAVRVPRC